MSSAPSQFLTIAGRWAFASKQSGIDRLPRKEQTLCLLMFYAGFGCALEATTELAAFDEASAVGLLRALHSEVETVEAVATRLFSGATPS